MSETNFPNVTPGPVLAGKCYICHDQPGTEDDGIGGKLCPDCAENARQVMRKHALSQVGYHKKSRK